MLKPMRYKGYTSITIKVDNRHCAILAQAKRAIGKKAVVYNACETGSTRTADKP